MALKDIRVLIDDTTDPSMLLRLYECRVNVAPSLSILKLKYQ